MASNKIVVVTGASRGIGVDTARLFARNGYDVCINYLKNDVAAEKVKRDILDIGRRCITVRADVSVGHEVANLFRTVDHTQ